jgi:hypothetical protein
MSFLTELRQVDPPPRRNRLAPLRHDWAPRRAQPAATRHPFAKALAIAGLTYVAATAVLMLWIAPHVSSGALAVASPGGAFGLLIVASLLPAFATAMMVRQSRQAWGVTRMVAAYLPLFLLVVALQFGGSAAEAWWPQG